MSHSPHAAPLSRRGLLKTGLLGSLLLAGAGLGASLSGCSPSTPARGFQVLREGDLAFLRALIPVLLDGAVSSGRMPAAVEQTLAGIDYNLAAFSPAMRKLTVQLFDALALPLSRGPLTGVWGDWEQATAGDMQAFLQRWQNSSLDLLQMGHAALLQLVMLAWYGQAEAWGHCGYPGPPQI